MRVGCSGEDNEGMTDVGEAASAMKSVLESIERGELAASKIEQARLEGAVAVLQVLADAVRGDVSD